MNTLFEKPCLLFLGDVGSALDAKTALGLLQWRPEDCVGQWFLPGCGVDIGIASLDPALARAEGARSLVIGVAPSGGLLPDHWIASLKEALEAGLDLVSGLHTPLQQVTELRECAARCGRQLIDVRIPPSQTTVGSGRARAGKRLLMVGTDCCVGKKYSALALHRAMVEQGLSATFRATGQTGIMIAGAGIPLDAVVADFLSGAAESLSPDNSPEHWDVIEGQGSLFHPAYAAVTLGLIHGSQPDAMVLCHAAGRTHIDEYVDYAIPSLSDCLRAYLAAASLTNPMTRFVGACINTTGLSVAHREICLREIEEELNLPCVDPLCGDLEVIVRSLSSD